MRKRDWADNEAFRLYDMVRDAVDEDKVIDEIARSLRRAARDIDVVGVTGPVGDAGREEG